MATVAKPFNTITQRFRVGAEVSEADDLAPHSFADLKQRRFIADAAPAEAASDAAPSRSFRSRTAEPS